MESENRLRFSLTIALVVLATASPLRAEVTKLQWDNYRTSASKPASKPAANSSTALKFVKPSAGSTKQADRSIKLTAYEADAPRLASGRDDSTRSVVVSRGDDSSNSLRAAQLPLPSPSAPSNKPEDGLRTPFNDSPANDGLPMPPPEENSTTAQPGSNAAQTNKEAPFDSLPQDAPGKIPAQADQFQPVLPAGPGPDQTPPTPPGADPNINVEGTKAKESCEKSLQNLRAYTVDKVNLNISITGTEGEDFPFECSIDDGTMFAGRCWEQTTYMWKASAMCHKPLYFEDEQLERYGHSFSPCFQPFVSGAHFFCTIPVLPYCMGVEPPCECIYALGHYRPGNCAPYMCNPVPLSLRGALFEAGVLTGAAAALP